jgi:hypothetical protein
LSRLAIGKSGDEAHKFFQSAYKKYAAAIEIKSDLNETFNKWGLALTYQALIKEGDEADTLFAKAGEKFATAIEIKPNYYEAVVNWGKTLFHSYPVNADTYYI